MSMLRFFALASLAVPFFLSVPSAAQQYCCDPDSDDFINNVALCDQEDGGYFEIDELVCDSDCTTDYTGGSGCTTIPLDGGLSLLALAGGGLATAAMRRRREEEEAAQEAA